MFVQIVLATPAYVWAILAALVAVGLLQMRDRTVSRPAVILPSLVASAWSVYAAYSGFPATSSATGAWFVGFGLAFLFRRLVLDRPAGVDYDPASRRYRIPGSTEPFVLFVSLFAVNYAVGVLRVMEPVAMARPDLIHAAAASLGFLGGSLFARAVAIVKTARSAAATLAAG